MTFRIVLAAPLFLALSACPPPGHLRTATTVVDEPQVLDTSLLDEFDRIATRLKAGAKMSEADWQAYADAIGSNNIGAGSLRRNYTLAFSPDQSDQRAAATGFAKIMVDHLRAQHDELPDLRLKLAGARFNDFAADALARTLAFLPESIDAGAPPPIRVVPFGLDAYGERDGVYIDPGLAMMLPPEQLHGLVAHEYHHVLAYRMASAPSLPDESPDAALYGALRQLQREGIADLIDKGSVPIEAPIPLMQPVADRFNAAYARAPKRIAEISRQLADYPLDDPSRAEAANAFRNGFVQGGHPLGNFMARTIDNALGRDALIATLPDPFRYIDAYQRAAALDPTAPPLGDDAIATIRTIKARTRS